MRGADGVAAHVLEDLDLALDCVTRGDRSQRALVVVHANTLDLHLLAVQRKTAGGIEVEETVAEVDVVRIDDLAVLLDLSAHRVKIRVVKAPQLGCRSGVGGGLDRDGRTRLDGLLSRCLGDLLLRLATAREHRTYHGERSVVLAVVLNRRLEIRLDARLVRSGELRSAHHDAVLGNVQRVGHDQVHIAPDAGAGIPAARRRLMVDLDDDGVLLAHLYIVGEVEGELRVAVGVGAELMPVDPYRGIHVHAVEVDADALARKLLAHGEALAVPTDTAQLVTALGLALLRVLLIDAVVVGQIHVLPSGVVELGRLRPLRIAQVELPVLVKALDARGRVVERVDVHDLLRGAHLRRRARADFGRALGKAVRCRSCEQHGAQCARNGASRDPSACSMQRDWGFQPHSHLRSRLF